VICSSFGYAARVVAFRFLSNHGMVLLSIAHDPRARMRDIAAVVGITERAAQRIVADLIAAEYVSRERDGRRNTYTVRTDLSISLPTQRDIDLGSLLSVLLPAGTSDERRDLIDHDHAPR
jgi:MarR family